jgi:hypothetical protein
MFNISNEIICNIILKAKEIGMEDDMYIEGDPETPETSDAKEILAEDKNDLTSSELTHIIKELEPDQQKELIALMLIGRGDFDKDQWVDAIKEANTIPAPSRAAYLISKSMLADYLQEGLSTFGYSCEE